MGSSEDGDYEEVSAVIEFLISLVHSILLIRIDVDYYRKCTCQLRWFRDQFVATGSRSYIYSTAKNTCPSDLPTLWAASSKGCCNIWGGNSICYKSAFAPSKDSDQTAHPHSLIGVFAVLLKTLDPWLWSECTDAQSDLSLRWAHIQSYRKCCAPAHMRISMLGPGLPPFVAIVYTIPLR